MAERRALVVALVVLVAVTSACGAGTDDPFVAAAPASAPSPAAQDPAADLTIEVDAGARGGEVSPLIRGVSGDAGPEYIVDAGITLNSWGGNPSSRYNYRLGNAWNAGADWEYRNGNYGASGDVAEQFVSMTRDAGAAVRLAVPTLGWVARDDDNATCSFPTPDGGCGGGEGASCTTPHTVADPETANVRSTSGDVARWIASLLDRPGLDVEYIAMDNEPELWGVTHYDVHPTCPTYEEIVDTYLEYATALRDVAPHARLTGPVMCCWYDVWDVAPGPADGSGEAFLPWFLDRVREHDAEYGRRTLDVVDVHYYPQSDVYDDRVDPQTAARRLRSTRSLYDPGYVDESWIARPIALIPRLRETIEEHYPGTPLMISEWSFGADASMNGALAIADVLGIYGREGVHAAAYWRSPPLGSPGYFAFKMHGNYDDRGSGFTGTSVRATTPDVDRVSAFATLDDDRLRVLLVNKDRDDLLDVRVDVAAAEPEAAGVVYRYSSEDPDAIRSAPVTVDGASARLRLPPSSLSLLVLTLDGGAT